MKDEITKRQINKIAKIYASGILYNAMGCGADSSLLTDEQGEHLQNQIEKLAYQVANGLPDEIFKIPSLDQIVIYVTKDNKKA